MNIPDTTLVQNGVYVTSVQSNSFEMLEDLLTQRLSINPIRLGFRWMGRGAIQVGSGGTVIQANMAVTLYFTVERSTPLNNMRGCQFSSPMFRPPLNPTTCCDIRNGRLDRQN